MKLSDKDLKDEELILLINEKPQVVDILMERYKGLVKSVAKSMYILGSEYDDLIQEGMIGLLKAIRNYDASKDASFYTFSKLCITRTLYNAVKSSRTKKNIPLNFYISGISSEKSEDDDEIMAYDFADIINDNPENVVVDNENVEALQQFIVSNLSPMERQVLELYVTGLKLDEIANVLGKKEKAVDNALQRARNKVKKRNNI